MGEVLLYMGCSRLRMHTVLGPYGRSSRTFLRAVRVLNFELPMHPKVGLLRRGGVCVRIPGLMPGACVLHTLVPVFSLSRETPLTVG